eukprot:506107-Amphidinium_carterae.1
MPAALECPRWDGIFKGFATQTKRCNTEPAPPNSRCFASRHSATKFLSIIALSQTEACNPPTKHNILPLNEHSFIIMIAVSM